MLERDVDVLEDLPAAQVVGPAEVAVEHEHHHRLGDSQIEVEKGGGHSETDQGDKIEPQAGLQQMAELIFLFHGVLTSVHST